ncbi:MAG: DUF4012 domain-containing protein [bacterium]
MNNPNQPPNQKTAKKKIILFGAVVLILLISIVGYSYYTSAKKIKTSADIIKTEIQNLQTAAKSQDFVQAKKSLATIEQNVNIVKKEIDGLNLAKVLPIVKDEIQATQNLINSTATVLSSAQRLVDIGAEMYKDLGIEGKTYKELDLGKLSGDQKGNIVVAIREAAPVLKDIKTEVDKASQDVDVLLNSPFAKYAGKDVILKIKKLTETKKLFDFAALASDYIPELIGYPNQANYLILLQNNTELRPTGGFIGTYALLQIKDSKVDNLFIDDVYNLDKTARERLFINPPWQLAKWNDTTQWFLRDANWSPNFPTSAEKVEWFYNQESQKDLDFTGIIAITPDVVSDILDLVGPITTHGITFTGENLIDVLEYRVEMEFRELGIPMAERKAVISDLADELQNRLENLPKEKWLDMANLLKQNLDEKHILLFFNDKNLQSIASESKWTGEIRPTDSDYLMVVDSNIGSLKTDSVMDKSIKYEMRREKSESGDEYLVGKVTLTYTNNGKFAWNLTRYRDFVRVYAPQGAELITAEGVMENDRSNEIGKVYIEDEFGKTVFGAFIAIEPKETRTLTIEYKLPTHIKDQIDQDKYNLLAQKQPGTAGHSLKVNFFGEDFKTDLSEDQMIYYTQEK